MTHPMHEEDDATPAPEDREGGRVAGWAEFPKLPIPDGLTSAEADGFRECRRLYAQLWKRERAHAEALAAAPAETPAPADDGGPAALTDAEVLSGEMSIPHQVLDVFLRSADGQTVTKDDWSLAVETARVRLRQRAARLDASREEGR